MDEKDDYIPVEKLNTRIRVYQGPTTKERAKDIASNVKQGFLKIRTRAEDVKERATPFFNKIKNSPAVKSQYQARGMMGSVGRTAVGRLEQRSRRNETNVYTSGSIGSSNPYTQSSSSNNPYNFTSNKTVKKKKNRGRTITFRY
jgi:hypothetical protein